MANPKRKSSKRKVRIRRSMNVKDIPAMQKCQQCGALHRPHRVCPSCGYYRGRQVISVEAK